MVKKVVKKVTKETVGTPVEDTQKTDSIRTKRKCLFCQNNTVPIFTDVATIRRFLTERSRITPKLRSGLCSKHQRILTKHIKYARHLALLPFTPKV